MKTFNTSGPNIPEEHYTIERHALLAKGIKMVESKRYFTIWAPRQTGKSTYFHQLAIKLELLGYKVAHINFENFSNEPISVFLERFSRKLQEFWHLEFRGKTIGQIFEEIETCNNSKFVLIVDEVEGINAEYFGTFLHAIRNAYHSRQTHSLKSVILVGVSNIVGVVGDHASPFNIADNLHVPYFSDVEVHELLGLHETATGQIFDSKVKEKICQITANQPGLVNGFAQQLVEKYPEKKQLEYNDFLQVENWYLNHAIDKNISNILNKAQEFRTFIERLLFTEEKVQFKINRPEIKYLYTNGLITDDGEGYVKFWVPLYQKAIFDAFFPYTNGEKVEISRNLSLNQLIDQDGEINFSTLIAGYKAYVKRRGFSIFREKNTQGNFLSIRESALVYSFETYIQAFLQVSGGKSYREADTGLGKSDLIINLAGKEYLIETKIYYYERQFLRGKKQLAHYCQSLGLKTGIYLVFCPNNIHYPESFIENTEEISGVSIQTFIVIFDNEKWD